MGSQGIQEISFYARTHELQYSYKVVVVVVVNNRKQELTLLYVSGTSGTLTN